MILTREQQELLINNFINEKHTQEECIGFIEGIKRTLNTVKCNPNTSFTRGEELLEFLNYCDSAGWIKNIDKKKVIGDYENSK